MGLDNFIKDLRGKEDKIKELINAPIEPPSVPMPIAPQVSFGAAPQVHAMAPTQSLKPYEQQRLREIMSALNDLPDYVRSLALGQMLSDIPNGTYWNVKSWQDYWISSPHVHILQVESDGGTIRFGYNEETGK